MVEVLVQGELAAGVQRRHLGAGPGAAGRAVERARPGLRPLPVELAGRHDGGVLLGRPFPCRRSREHSDGDAFDLRVVRVRHGKLLARRRLDHLSHPGHLPRPLRNDLEPVPRGVGDHVEHATVGDIDLDRTEVRHLDGSRDVHREGGNVLESDASHLAVLDRGLHLDESRRRLELEPGEGLGGFHHPGLDEGGHYADGVGARHAGVLHLFHDHKAGVRLGVIGGQHEIAVGGGIAAGFAEHALSQAVGPGGEMAHLVEHGVAGHIEHTADDDPAMLSRRVQVHGMDHSR